LKTLILNQKQIQQKLSRLAYQIYEANYTEKSLVLAGIFPNGFLIATQLQGILQKISGINAELMQLTIDKENPLQMEISVSPKKISLEGRSVIVTDDVLNSGRTMMYGVTYFLQFPIKSLHTAVLIDRDHKQYPISADYVGLSLSTNLQEHVMVELSEGTSGAYLL
jgi:pyrimidine operon attenuation protein / uracil phosphoribosyltransferase